MAEKIPKWESELWSYISDGDGVHCPLQSRCRRRFNGSLCIEGKRELLDRLKLLLDDDSYPPGDHDVIKPAKYGKIFKLLELLAEKYLRQARIIHPPVPIECISLADDSHPVEIRLLPLKAYRGAIWRHSGKWIIQLKADDTRARQRFTAFHEAFHILAHCRATPTFKKKGSETGFFNELLADYFALFLMMPGKWLTKKWDDVNDVQEMAKLFDVPASLMFVRLKYLGLV